MTRLEKLNNVNRLNFSRFLILLGFCIGIKSLFMTFSHIGDDTYILIEEFSKGATHAWYHAFREGVGDITAMISVIFIFFFVKERRRSHWWICLFILVGYYAPFWIGTPFLKELGAPHWKAELIHILMAFFPIVGLFLGRKSFNESEYY